MVKIFFTLLIFFIVCSTGYAIEEQFEDVVATVVVGSTFRMSIDKDNLDFGQIEPGKKIELYPDRYYNQITSLSNNGNIWYLKMSLAENLQGPREGVIAKDKLRWQVSSTDGDGVRVEGWHSFEQDRPSLIYTSGPEDSRGKEVNNYLKYALDVPGDATAGNYQTVIVYTMTETP